MVTISEGKARSPSFAILPPTATRPASIPPSISRRDPSPAAARSFCSRSAVGAPDGLAVGPCGGLGSLRSVFFGTDSRFRGGGGWFKGKSLGDFLERRQLLQRAQPEVVEELARRGVERRPARSFAVADDVDPAAILQRLDRSEERRVGK